MVRTFLLAFFGVQEGVVVVQKDVVVLQEDGVRVKEGVVTVNKGVVVVEDNTSTRAESARCGRAKDGEKGGRWASGAGWWTYGSRGGLELQTWHSLAVVWTRYEHSCWRTGWAVEGPGKEGSARQGPGGVAREHGEAAWVDVWVGDGGMGVLFTAAEFRAAAATVRSMVRCRCCWPAS
jgi:hypothetical protein